ncbi:MAG: phosphoribosyltransferase [Halopenitus sp.]
MFQDRTDAGQQLADVLRERDLDADLVLGIPRGALPVARPVADALGVTLDIVVAKKMSAPENPEFAIGAAASDGSVYLDDETIERLGVDSEYIERERERSAETAREKVETYRQGEPPEVAGKSVVVVDDGVATGATMTACVRHLQAQDADRIIVAVPVGSPRSLAELEADADEVIALDEPEGFRAVGQFYRRFGQVSDEKAIAYLRGEQ